MDATLGELLRRHAFERGVSKDALCNDMIHLVVEAITDTNDEMFNPLRFGLPPLDPIPERRPGYRESLGIVVATMEDSQSHLSPVPRAASDTALLSTVIPENEP